MLPSVRLASGAAWKTAVMRFARFSSASATDTGASVVIYKVVPRAMWVEALNAGHFGGGPVDLRDGYIHLSTADQVEETVRLHFAGQGVLMLIGIDAEALGPALKWELSRGGALFPHLYGNLPLSAVVSSLELPSGPDGFHPFPDAWRAPSS